MRSIEHYLFQKKISLRPEDLDKIFAEGYKNLPNRSILTLSLSHTHTHTHTHLPPSGSNVQQKRLHAFTVRCALNL
jgi:hypothetical protein